MNRICTLCWCHHTWFVIDRIILLWNTCSWCSELESKLMKSTVYYFGANDTFHLCTTIYDFMFHFLSMSYTGIHWHPGSLHGPTNDLINNSLINLQLPDYNVVYFLIHKIISQLCLISEINYYVITVANEGITLMMHKTNH